MGIILDQAISLPDGHTVREQSVLHGSLRHLDILNGFAYGFGQVRCQLMVGKRLGSCDVIRLALVAFRGEGRRCVNAIPESASALSTTAW